MSFFMLHETLHIEHEEGKSTTLEKLLARLEERASEKGLTIVDRDRSGNCMFSSLSDQLKLVEDTVISHKELRQSIVRYLRTIPNWVSVNVFDLALCHYLLHRTEQDSGCLFYHNT